MDMSNHAMDAGRYAMESLKPVADEDWDDINKDLKNKWRL